jgi:PAS domain S-box-containing protein
MIDAPNGANPAEWSWLEQIADGVVIVDQLGTIVFANRRVCQMFAVQLVDILGRPIEILLRVGDRATHERHRARYAANPTVREMGSGLNICGVRGDGATIDLDIHLKPVTELGVTVASVRARERTHQSNVQHVLLTREREARALLDLVVQRLYGISLSLDALPASTGSISPHIDYSNDLISDTIEMIRANAFVHTPPDQHLAMTQAELTRRHDQHER